MFNTLEEQIEEAEGAVLTTKQRFLRYAILLVLSMVIFAGLYTSATVNQLSGRTDNLMKSHRLILLTAGGRAAAMIARGQYA